MKHYRVNKNTDTNPGGHNEVHSDDCIHYSHLSNYEYLGLFSCCQDAVVEAKERGYKNADGCRICSSDCHSG